MLLISRLVLLPKSYFIRDRRLKLYGRCWILVLLEMGFPKKREDAGSSLTLMVGKLLMEMTPWMKVIYSEAFSECKAITNLNQQVVMILNKHTSVVTSASR